MIMMLFFLVPALIYGIIDIVPDIRAGGKKIPVVYLGIMTVALVLWICVWRGVPLKSPSQIVTSLLKMILPIG
jgi:hypothetical protein